VLAGLAFDICMFSVPASTLADIAWRMQKTMLHDVKAFDGVLRRSSAFLVADMIACHLVKEDDSEV
jgi:hypothetical protein